MLAIKTFKIPFMKLGETMLKKISKKYEPDTMVRLKFKGYDMVLKTDAEGNALLLFIGQAQEDGHIKGHRFARRLLKDAAGNTIKDHWDYKGKVS